MDDAERAVQQRLHEAIEQTLRDSDELDDGEVLTGWIVIHETAALTSDATAGAGHFYGPAEMTTWRALGLVEWARRFGLKPDDDEDDQ
jgi:hypothetical protein